MSLNKLESRRKFLIWKEVPFEENEKMVAHWEIEQNNDHYLKSNTKSVSLKSDSHRECKY